MVDFDHQFTIILVRHLSVCLAQTVNLSIAVVTRAYLLGHHS